MMSLFTYDTTLLFSGSVNHQEDMIKELGKLVVLAASSAVVVPYTIAFLANMLYGWPRGNRKLHRAFHPQKVYALNYAVLQEFTKLR